MREIYSWDLGIKLGEIPQPPKTYNVMGNANEQGLAIGETTHGGLSVLSNVGKTVRTAATSRAILHAHTHLGHAGGERNDHGLQ